LLLHGYYEGQFNYGLSDQESKQNSMKG